MQQQNETGLVVTIDAEGEHPWHAWVPTLPPVGAVIAVSEIGNTQHAARFKVRGHEFVIRGAWFNQRPEVAATSTNPKDVDVILHVVNPATP